MNRNNEYPDPKRVGGAGYDFNNEWLYPVQTGETVTLMGDNGRGGRGPVAVWQEDPQRWVPLMRGTFGSAARVRLPYEYLPTPMQQQAQQQRIHLCSLDEFLQ